MTDPTPEQIAKLPRWAQSYIAHLEQVECNLQARVDELCNDSPTCVSLAYREPTKYLPEDSTVEFQLGDRRSCVRVTMGRDRFASTRHLAINADDTIRIEPSASNSIGIYVKG